MTNNTAVNTVVGIKDSWNNWMVNEVNDFNIDLTTQNKCYLPKIDRVIFNLGEKPEKKELRSFKNNETGKWEKREVVIPSYKTLATIIYFKDGTKVSVVNSIGDAIDLNEDGTVTNDAKERGIVYAIVKRLVGRYDKNGKFITPGLGRELNYLIKNAYDCQAENKKRAEAEAKRKEELAKVKPNPKRKRESLSSVVDRLNEASASLADVAAKLAANVAG